MIKAWRDIAIPHQDVLKGTFKQSEFAADLSQVHLAKPAKNTKTRLCSIKEHT